MSNIVETLISDEDFAANAIASAAANGFYVECYGYEDENGQPAYYAYTAAQSEYEALLAEINRQFLVGFKEDKYKDPGEVFVPRTKLPWTDFISQPTYISGKSTRREAIIASMDTYKRLARK